MNKTYIIQWKDGQNEFESLLEKINAEWWQGILSSGCCQSCCLTQDGYYLEGYGVPEERHESFIETLTNLKLLYDFDLFIRTNLSDEIKHAGFY